MDTTPFITPFIKFDEEAKYVYTRYSATSIKRIKNKNTPLLFTFRVKHIGTNSIKKLIRGKDSNNHK